MHTLTKGQLASSHWSIAYIVLIPVIVAAFLVWNGKQRIDEFEQSHYQIAEASTTIIANKISLLIKEQQRLLKLFAKYEHELLYQISLSPEDDTLRKKLNDKVGEAFPNYFAVAIADKNGESIFDDFDGLYGELCLEDIKQHAKGKTIPIRIHPHNLAYHIDIMVPWEHLAINFSKLKSSNYKLAAKGIFFVSFKPTFLYQLLEISSPPNHEFMLVNSEYKDLIEITEHGTRKDLKRDDYHLTQEEKNCQLFSTPVKNSMWKLVDFRKANLFSDYRQNIIDFSLVILILFIIGSVLMTALILRAEKSRIKAEEIKEEMFSLFNHDLGAPLNSIFGFLEVFTETEICKEKPEKCDHFASVAMNNAEMMREIINDILDLQKMEAGEMSFVFEEVNLINVVENTVEMNIQQSIKSKVHLEVKYETDELYIKADSRRLTQAITNLLSNAMKYSAKNDTVTVTVSSHEHQAIIYVTDHGPGIEKEFQKLVFDKFAQSKSKLTRQVGGTGLGLTIVKHIVEAHHGLVSFDSKVNQGTTFKIVLPY
ncbi:MAG: HAMP domain-containing sensor histidine kinase [Woeseiaceae bacterium]